MSSKRFFQKRFDNYYEKNEVAVGGSHYLRSKIKNAYEVLRKEFKNNDEIKVETIKEEEKVENQNEVESEKNNKN